MRKDLWQGYSSALFQWLVFVSHAQIVVQYLMTSHPASMLDPDLNPKQKSLDIRNQIQNLSEHFPRVLYTRVCLTREQLPCLALIWSLKFESFRVAIWVKDGAERIQAPQVRRTTRHSILCSIIHSLLTC